jgi:hypothetical protein
MPPGTNGHLDLEEGIAFPVSWGEGLRCTKEPGEVQEPARGVPPIRLVRTRVQIQSCLRRQTGACSTSSETP